jgi:NDP-sugar pyrophosphorylase family protein
MSQVKVTGVVLAAGFGTRLRPSTDVCPKPLIPVAGVEPLFFALEKLKNLGVQDAIVNAHYLPEKIEEALKSWAPLFPKMKIHISIERPSILGTGGALLKILRDFPELFVKRGLLLLNGDTLASFDPARLFSDPDQSRFAVSFRADHLKKYKPLWVTPDLRYSGIGAQPPTPDSRPAHFLGVHYLSPGDIKSLTSKKLPVIEIDLFNGIYKPLIQEGRAFTAVKYFGKESADFWFDMTNTEFLLEAQRYLLDSLKSAPQWAGVLRARYPGIREVEPGVWVLSKNKQPSSRRYYSPAVFIESDSSPHDREFGSFSLGPHASLIHSRGQLLAIKRESALEIRDAVVLVSSEKNSSLPEKIQGEVRVV